MRRITLISFARLLKHVFFSYLLIEENRFSCGATVSLESFVDYMLDFFSIDPSLPDELPFKDSTYKACTSSYAFIEMSSLLFDRRKYRFDSELPELDDLSEFLLFFPNALPRRLLKLESWEDDSLHSRLLGLRSSPCFLR